MTETSGGRSAVRALLVRVGERRLALRLDEVREVMRALPTDVVAGQPAHVRGVAIVRGRPRVVVDLGLLTTGRPTTGAYYVLARTGDRSIVLAVDAIDGIVAMSGESLADIPDLRRGEAPSPLAAVSLRQRAPVFLVDLAGLARLAPPGPGTEAA